ncbi:glycosyltransferase family 2 protein [Curtobacterium sp. RRHDQ66]|uniref:glycosyltransferase family 2 protein n=1 Tax=Curtobacterium guangdongense TaxID=3413380 RepID=UPI003BF00C71
MSGKSQPIHFLTSDGTTERRTRAALSPAPELTEDLNARLQRIAIVIPVLNDRRVHQCLDSIRSDLVSVVIVSNGSTNEFNEELRQIERPNVTIITSRTAGIGPAYNLGIARTDKPWILLMDADCTFEPGAVEALAAGMDLADFVRGRVVFDEKSIETSIPARARRFTEDALHSRRITAYSPPLLYRKDVVALMGGYHFDDRLAWREDREFELRRRSAGIAIAFAMAGVIHHAPLRITADLRSLRSYGRSEAVGRALGLFPAEPARSRAAKTLRTAWRVLYRDHAPDAAAYIFVRRLAFSIGRLEQMWTIRTQKAQEGSIVSNASYPRRDRRG